MDKMISIQDRVGFCEDIHTNQRRAKPKLTKLLVFNAFFNWWKNTLF